MKLYKDLFEAVEENNIELVKNLLKKKNIDLNLQKDNWTMLMRASANGNIECVQLLLKFGANPNIQSVGNKSVNYGWTALMDATVNHYIKCIRLLLKAGANPYLKNKDNYNALDYALRDYCYYYDVHKIYKNTIKTLKRMIIVVLLCNY